MKRGRSLLAMARRLLKWIAWAFTALLSMLFIGALLYAFYFGSQCQALKKRMQSFTPMECEAIIREARAYAERQNPERSIVRIDPYKLSDLPPALRSLKPQTIRYSPDRISMTLLFLVNDGVSCHILQRDGNWILEGTFYGADPPIQLYVMSADHDSESMMGK